MNTADRSIKMLDTALRRRFGFVELMPDPGLLASRGRRPAARRLPRALNRRVAHEAGREKQIGHSFFLKDGQPVTRRGEFAAIFRDEIVPLLQEYAVDDYDELCRVPRARRSSTASADARRRDPRAIRPRLLEALEEHLLGSAAEA